MNIDFQDLYVVQKLLYVNCLYCIQCIILLLNIYYIEIKIDISEIVIVYLYILIYNCNELINELTTHITHMNVITLIKIYNIHNFQRI